MKKLNRKGAKGLRKGQEELRAVTNPGTYTELREDIEAQRKARTRDVIFIIKLYL